MPHLSERLKLCKERWWREGSEEAKKLLLLLIKVSDYRWIAPLFYIWVLFRKQRRYPVWRIATGIINLLVIADPPDSKRSLKTYF